ncbi:PREDICTED: putative nuclease HARBI1 isoform X2 [Vollenhovia emeryi]|uniref:putative nuclease HARBI1 isoform X2 n=1 Tax=Vollenhovia emeryi TaxID=411798 RepID=UPI0005F438EC|nr:PREDICTED: putative nuclease HARBI1 isoform X2 [Vollenhovia emeryi]
MESIHPFVAVYLTTIENMFVQCTSHVRNNLMKRRRRLKEIILQHLLNSTPPNHLLDLGPILKFSREREIWMKERSFDWWHRIVNGHFKDEDWIETFRMTKVTFLWLCDQLRERLVPNVNQIGTREPVSVEKQVAVCLYFLSSCCEYRIVGTTFGIHKATVWKCIHKVIDAINIELMSSWISMPDNDECHEIAEAFEKKTHIPQLIGAIDGTHIPILPSSDGYRDYINRKRRPSMILQAVVDNNYRFRNIHCGSPGSCHDAAVFQTSKLYRNCNLLIPKEILLIRYWNGS